MSGKKLIEVALPLASINAEASREKSIRHGHPSTLHLWWARRPLAAARAVIWSSLVDDPSSDSSLSVEEQDRERERLFKILEQLVVWENSNNPTVLAAAKAEIDRCFPDGPPPVLDPFGGGGAIPLEAQRLGLTALSGDLNPVAVLIQKAMIEIPPRFANRPPVHPDLQNELNTWTGAQGLAADVEAYGQWMRDEAEKQIDYLYPKVVGENGEELTPIAWIWARTVKSPDPTWPGHVPLVASWTLSKKPKKPTVWIEPIINRTKHTITYEIREGGSPEIAETVSRQGGYCIATGAAIPFDYIRAEGRAGRHGRALLAIVAEGSGGRMYCTATEQPDISPPQDSVGGSLSGKATVNVGNYGLTEWKDLFSPRQLTALTTFSELLKPLRERVVVDARERGMPSSARLSEGGDEADAYADAIITYLAFAVDKCSDYWSTICSWHNSGEKIRNTFGRQAIPMTWDFAETNPFSSSSGNWMAMVNWVHKAVAHLPTNTLGEAVQRDARARVRENPGVVLSTDPPYYDNISYADLSDFFYAWLRRNLSDVWPDECATLTTPKADELIAHAGRAGSKQAAEQHFEAGMAEFMADVKAGHHPDVPSTIYYAYKATETKNGEVTSTGWSTFLQAIIDAGLTVTATWPMRTELSNRMIASGTNALASSIVLSCRPREIAAPLATRGEFMSALRAELPEAVRVLQSGNIAPVDVAQSTIGPGIGVFSRYSKVVEADGSTMTVATALSIINEVLGEILDGEESEMDNDSRFALAWYSQHAYNPAASGDAMNLAQAKNTTLDGLVDAGIAHAQGGKFRLLERDEMQEGWDPAADDRRTVWEATQYLVAALDRSETQAGELLARLGSYGERARQLAYLLFKKATDNGWADEAGAYNNLVTAWPNLQTTTASATGPAQSALDI